jgi:hypothetical protein
VVIAEDGRELGPRINFLVAALDKVISLSQFFVFLLLLLLLLLFPAVVYIYYFAAILAPAR